MSPAALALTAALTQNVILVRFLAPWPFPALVRSPRRAALVSLVATIVLVWSATLYGVLYRAVLAPFGLVYLETIGLLVILSVTFLLLLRLTITFAPTRYPIVRSAAPMMLFNAMVLVVAMALPRAVDRPVLVPFVALATGAGIFIALVPLAAIRHRLDRSRLPRPLRGDTAVYLATALTAVVVQRLDEMLAALHAPLW